MRIGRVSVLWVGLGATALLESQCGKSSGAGHTTPADAGARDAASIDGGTPPGTDSSVPPGTDGSGPPDTAPPPPPPLAVVQHHNDGYRDGRYVDDIFTHSAAATTHVISSFAGAVTGPVRAQPLWVEDGPGGNEAFIVATDSNHVTAIGATGATVWDRSYGPPVPLGHLPCGNIDPLGITGTPYIDVSSRTIYFDEMTSPDSNVTLKHMVYAISLDDGSVKPAWPVDVNATVAGFDSAHQNERGALQLVNGILYVPYGGHDGDCDPYFGWVVGFPIANPTAPKAWHTTATRGGIWGPGSLPTDGTSIFPVTGNTTGTSTWGQGEAVLRLAAGPTYSGATADYYTPSNWQSLDTSDLDLGGANDILLDMPGAPRPHLVIAPGKDGNLYILDRDNLGGIGGELSKTNVSNGQLNGAGATYTTSKGTYVALHSTASGVGCPDGNVGNLIVVRISATNPPTPTVVWCAADGTLGSPMVTTTDGTSNAIVWDTDCAGNASAPGPWHLWAFDGDTGAKLFDGTNTVMATSMSYFNTPIDAKGRIAAVSDSQLYVFTP
jgi:hypothetical protein